MKRLRNVLLGAILVAAAACSDAPLALANIQTGRSLNGDNSIASISTLFKPNETIYVSVQTTGSAPGTIGVKWKYQGRVIDEPTKQVDPAGPASTSFQLQNSGGFPEGDYSVDILINGEQVGTRNFRVSS
jgi:outer membrane usher protein FimD/PapC